MHDIIGRCRQRIRQAETVLIGAGAGLSTAAGFVYSGERFEKYFGDFARKYHFTDMYSGGFYPYSTQEEFWAYWSRYIYINRYMNPPKDTYEQLLRLVKDKDHFVLTTNVDHCFQKAGFDKQRLFYTQGDYGLFQCSQPCHRKTYDNEAIIRQMVLSQGYEITEDGTLSLPEGVKPSMSVPADLLPRCPVCGRPMTMNLRSDGKFVEDEGWHAAAERYSRFLAGCAGKNAAFLEIGVGYNTPGIIKYPFWQQVYQNERAVYICLNKEEAPAPREIADRALTLAGDCHRIIGALAE